jgi:hypothetical protein
MEEEIRKQEKNQIYVALLSNYLTENFVDRGDDPEYVKMQEEKYDYNRNNFSNIKSFETDSINVKLEKWSDHDLKSPILADFAIASATENWEDVVRSYRGSGLIIARYSIFYGGPSHYTERFPQDSGYALDIPKNIGTVKALLKDSMFLTSLMERNKSGIESALSKFNKEVKIPVLITPYLETVLNEEPLSRK